ncbi:hypothetical protein [Conexibacter woesei]|uniref:Secreted protein n=1 Tax=Conexibacter woesei (strain DSM 14684 / CCUG 47730 / CIP 108061 / JCM 11494 / NBRC 100937 / ID131577) TaxID=469383 RepID=D3F8B8_CONWI|nr:hypothetical protein [Conexibacter woesei]ADB48988.1 conserved hypothetical protein [Conexibacter woesei DSM 14684]
MASKQTGRGRRTIALLAASATVAACASTVGAGSAAAVTNCDGLTAVTFSPGITFTPAPASLTTGTVLARCISTDRPDITGGTSDGALPSGQRSCLNPLIGGRRTRTYRWNTGETSTIDYVDNASYVAGNIVVEQLGTVVSGPFRGQGTSGTIVLTGNFPACLTTGLTSVSGPHVLAIL